MLRQPYIDSKALIALIRSYKRTKDPQKKDILREQIFNNNIRFIRKLVLRKASSNPQMIEDVFNSAVLSFFKGLDKFKIKPNTNFQTYIGYWIDKAIYEEYVASNIVYIPRGLFFNKITPEIYSAKNVSMIYMDKRTASEEGTFGHNDWIDRLINKGAVKKNSLSLDLSDRLVEIKNQIDKKLTPIEKAFMTWKYLYNPPLDNKEISEIVQSSVSNVKAILYGAIAKIYNNIEVGEGFIRNQRGSTLWIHKIKITDQVINDLYLAKINSPKLKLKCEKKPISL